MSLTVLLVEDDRALRELITRHLRAGRGFDVHPAGTLLEARRVLSEGRVDVLLADVGLPDGLGLELAEGPGVPPTIVMTADGSVEHAVSAMHLGVVDFLVKPIDFDVLDHAIARAVERGAEGTGGKDGDDDLPGGGPGVAKANTDRHRAPSAPPPRRDPDAFRRRFAPGILGSDAKLLRVFDVIERISDTDCTVLVTGESGTGKELVARAIHEASDRNTAPFVAVNCAAIPENLLESELFGHVRGAFTGATSGRVGRFAAANGGTLFLDEIGELPIALQAKLLRALQEKEITPVGDVRSQKVDVRIVTATNRSLEDMVAAGQFREDLLYRLNVIPIELPALRERKGDVPELCAHFLHRTNRKRGRDVHGITAEAMAALVAYDWPGNVRELENTVERMVVLRSEGELGLDDLPRNIRRAADATGGRGGDPTLPEDGIDLRDAVEQFENALILQALERTGWNKNQAAAILRMNRTTLVEKLKKKQLDASRAA